MTDANLDQLLRTVTVLGAGGKMGRQISALMAVEMANSALQHQGDKSNGGLYRLNLVDIDPTSLEATRAFVNSFARSYAEKNTQKVRVMRNDPTLGHNAVHIDRYGQLVAGTLRSGTDVEAMAGGSRLVVETIFEEESQKIDLLRRVDRIAQAMYLTNTSSIPIRVLAEGANLDSRMIGFHFFNPPTFSKLLELIPVAGQQACLETAAVELAKRMGKTVVRSADVAGFIGNGHMIGECLYAANELLPELQKEANYSEPAAIYAINEATQKLLVRPMGIFQLMDFVGIDVIEHIIDIMRTHGTSGISSQFIAEYARSAAKGGQNFDGSQKPGFFQYEKGRITGIYDRDTRAYVPLSPKPEWVERTDTAVAALTKGLGYKALSTDREADAKLRGHFTQLRGDSSVQATIAKLFLLRSSKEFDSLSTNNIAAPDDITTVLKLGYGHLYEPGKYAALVR